VFNSLTGMVISASTFFLYIFIIHLHQSTIFSAICILFLKIFVNLSSFMLSTIIQIFFLIYISNTTTSLFLFSKVIFFHLYFYFGLCLFSTLFPFNGHDQLLQFKVFQFLYEATVLDYCYLSE
jgi:hypothetical protein